LLNNLNIARKNLRSVVKLEWCHHISNIVIYFFIFVFLVFIDFVFSGFY